MDSLQLLNQFYYASSSANVRRSTEPLHSNQVLTTGTTEYFFFITALGNPFLRNMQMPLSGTNIFFINSIVGYLQLNITTTALTNALNELLQQSFLEISVDNRVVCKLPGLDFINYMYGDVTSDQVVLTRFQPRLGGNKNSDGTLGRKLPIPIVYNSQSAFQFRFVTTAAAATAFNGINFKLALNGVRFDKLDYFNWDEVKGNLFSRVPVTYYETRAIANGNQTTYQLFNNIGVANNLISKTFPLPNTYGFSLQNMEIFFNQPDTPIEPTTIYNSRITNILRMNVNNVQFYEAVLNNDLTSVVASFGQTLTTTPNLDCVTTFNQRVSKTFDVPLNIAPTSNVEITLEQPASSLGITGEITIALRGVETRTLV